MLIAQWILEITDIVMYKIVSLEKNRQCLSFTDFSANWCLFLKNN